MPNSHSLLLLDTRRRIYDHLRRVPGSHLRQLQRDLAVPLGTLEYHLHQMERAELVVSRSDGRFKAFYCNEELDRRDRDLLYYLRQDMCRRIALEIVQTPAITFQSLAARLPVSASTLSFHLKKLRRAGFVSEIRQGREKAYECTDPERVRALILRYRSTFIDDVVDRFAEAWLELDADRVTVTDIREAPDASPEPAPEPETAARPRAQPWPIESGY